MDEPVITPEQCRAARALLGWSQKDLAAKSKAGIVTIHKFEAGKTDPVAGTLSLLRQAFEKAGIIFIPKDGGGVGVRLKR